MATANSEDLKALAQQVADAVPVAVADEIVLTGSVSRGVADDLSDIEMLIVTAEPRELEACFALARAAGLEELGTWGAQEGPARRVSGRRQQVPIELIWWPREYAESRIDLLRAGESASTADALVHGVPLRTIGLLTAWQDRLRLIRPTWPPRRSNVRPSHGAASRPVGYSRCFARETGWRSSSGWSTVRTAS